MGATAYCDESNPDKTLCVALQTSFVAQDKKSSQKNGDDDSGSEENHRQACRGMTENSWPIRQFNRVTAYQKPLSASLDQYKGEQPFPRQDTTN